MIGDSIKNDIKGANNYGIKSALVCNTGLTSVQIYKNNILDEQHLQNLIDRENIDVNYLLHSVSENSH